MEEEHVCSQAISQPKELPFSLLSYGVETASGSLAYSASRVLPMFCRASLTISSDSRSRAKEQWIQNLFALRVDLRRMSEPFRGITSKSRRTSFHDSQCRNCLSFASFSEPTTNPDQSLRTLIWIAFRYSDIGWGGIIELLEMRVSSCFLGLNHRKHALSSCERIKRSCAPQATWGLSVYCLWTFFYRWRCNIYTQKSHFTSLHFFRLNGTEVRESRLPCDTGNHVTLQFVGVLFAEKFWNNYGTSVK